MANNWTREQTIVALYVYCMLPFGQISGSNKLIQKLAPLIGRTPNALNMKAGNIGRLDPELQKRGVGGLKHGAKLDEEIWNEFRSDPQRLAKEVTRILNHFQEEGHDILPDNETIILPEGTTREAFVKQRVNQAFFRRSVVSAYGYSCCISGVKEPTLVEACHIVDWAKDKENRTNPRNGLAMNPFFHKAYDNNLIGITPDLEIKVSEELLSSISREDFKEYLENLRNTKIQTPNRFSPLPELLEKHYDKYLQRV